MDVDYVRTCEYIIVRTRARATYLIDYYAHGSLVNKIVLRVGCHGSLSSKVTLPSVKFCLFVPFQSVVVLK